MQSFETIGSRGCSLASLWQSFLGLTKSFLQMEALAILSALLSITVLSVPSRNANEAPVFSISERRRSDLSYLKALELSISTRDISGSVTV
jgi:hypothetical protein